MRGAATFTFIAIALPALAQNLSGFVGQMKIPKEAGKEGPHQLPVPRLDASQTLKVLHCDRSTYENGVQSFEGNVRLEYKGYQIEGDKVRGSPKTEVWIMEGHGRLVGEGNIIRGDRIVSNFLDRTYSYQHGSSEVSPDELKGNVTGPLYVTAEDGAGTDKELRARKSHTTTCDLDHPHYELVSDSTRVVFGRYAILRKVDLIIMGHKVLSLPYLVIPLNDSSRLTPDIGYNDDEGYYIKTKLWSPVHGKDVLATRLDYMTKKGFGLGNDYDYMTDSMYGAVSYYFLTGDTKTFTANSDHQMKLGSGVFTFGSNYQKNNYLTSPDSTSTNIRSQYTVNKGPSGLRLGFTRYDNSTADFSSSNQTLTMSQNQQWLKGFTTKLDLNLGDTQSKSQGVVQSHTDRLDVRFEADGEERDFTSSLLYQRGVKVAGDDVGYSSSSDETPLLTVKTDSGRLSNNKVRSDELQLMGSIGELHDPADPTPITRTQFEGDFRRREGHSQDQLQLNWGGRFQQSLYSDNTAQYIMDYDGRLSYNYAKESSFNVNYHRIAQVGFTPLAIDSYGRSDSFNIDSTYKPAKTLSMSVQTGYDVVQASSGNTPWQMVNFNTNYSPGPLTRFQFNATYDTYNIAWSALRLDSQFYLGPTKVNLGIRYDALRSTWAAADLTFIGFQSGKVSLDGLLSYNGYTQQFDAQQFELRYDLHCAELVFQYTDNSVGFRPGRQIALLLRVKALPFTSNFGVGQRGQAIGSSGF